MRCLIIVMISCILLIFQDVAGFQWPGIFTEPTANNNSSGDNECTILVISGNAAIDGRPIIWKNRDVVNPEQKYLFIPARTTPTDTTFAFNGNFYADDSSRCYMGVNEKGFAIINANCYNLDDILNDGIDDGDLMCLALEQCQNIDDWENLLQRTNLVGRKDAWLFGVMDAFGAAKLYECSNFDYYVYDANNPNDAPDGIIVRSVFALAGSYTDKGAERYKRARHLIVNRPTFRPIDVKYILQNIARDLYSSLGDPYPLPFMGQIGNLPGGFINTDETINRFKTRSCSVIRGIRPGEDPRLATTFAILGPPVLSIAVPLWVASYTVPDFFCVGNNASWFQIISERMRQLYPVAHSQNWMNTRYLVDVDSSGVYSYTLGLETWAIDQADQMLESWYGQLIDTSDVCNAQDSIAETIWSGFLQQSNILENIQNDNNILPDYFSHSCYPNPFNTSVAINFKLTKKAYINSISVDVYNILGKKVIGLGKVELENSEGNVIWNGCDQSGLPVGAGVYFYVITTQKVNCTGKMLLLK